MINASGLPAAKMENKTFRIGGIVTKNEVPTITLRESREAIDNLEKAAKEQVFNENGEQ